MKFNKLLILSSLCGLFVGAQSCNLDEEVLDGVSRDNAVLEPGEVDPETALQPIYQNISGAYLGQGNAYALQMHPSDELIPPVRGTDWYDFGVWTSLHTHQWNATHPEILNAWNTLHQGATRANQAILATTGERKAQARFLRAFLVWQIADFWGQVPFRDENDVDFLTPPGVLTRAEAIDFVISEVEAVMNNLPVRQYGEPDKASAHAFLAKVYLNRFIYLGLEEAPASDMQKVVEHAEAVEAAGFSLAPGEQYFTANFGVNNEDSPEAIFVIRNETGQNRGAVLGSKYHQTLHYNQNPSGWNGFTTIADFYNKFDQEDKRFYADPTATMAAQSGLHFGFLQGIQTNAAGEPLTIRGGQPLDFTVQVPLTGATEEQGVRVLKFEPDYANTAVPGNDYPLIRYADVLLMKAEALWRMGNMAEALAALNKLRLNRGVDSLTAVDADAILNERGFELYWEGHRRTDLIRFGKFTQAWNEKPESQPFRVLFPIPQAAVDSNPDLEQNAGY